MAPVGVILLGSVAALFWLLRTTGPRDTSGTGPGPFDDPAEHDFTR